MPVQVSNAHTPVVALAFVLSAVLAVQADPPASQRAPGAGRVVFADDFNGPLNRRLWAAASGAVSTADPSGGALLNAAGDRQPTLRSRAIRLDGAAAAAVAIELVALDPRAGALQLSVRDAAGAWRRLAEVAAADAPAPAGTARCLPLPPEALHEACALRLRAPGGGPWRVAAVRIEAFDQPRLLALGAEPAAGATIHVIDLATETVLALRAPDVSAWSEQDRVALIAPATAEDAVFGYWTHNGQVRERRAVIARMSDDLEATAHYLAPQAGPGVVRVVVRSTPVDDVAVGVSWGELPPHELARTPLVCEALADEWLTLSAPPRADGWVFESWRVDGLPQPQGAPTQAFLLRRDLEIVADYARLGDMNGDGLVDRLDVDAFTLALADPQRYAQRFPEIEADERGDINGDGWLDEGDVEPFVRLFFAP